LEQEFSSDERSPFVATPRGSVIAVTVTIRENHTRGLGPADGTTRDAYLGAEWQYAIADDSRQVRGVWLLTDQVDEADVPVLVLFSS
jgi:hypothetical protein